MVQIYVTSRWTNVRPNESHFENPPHKVAKHVTQDLKKSYKLCVSESRRPIAKRYARSNPFDKTHQLKEIMAYRDKDFENPRCFPVEGWLNREGHHTEIAHPSNGFNAF